MTALLCLLGLFIPSALAQDAAVAPATEATRSYALIVLVKGPAWNEGPIPAETDEGHNAFLQGLQKQGVLLAAGELEQSPDHSLMAMCIYDGSPADALALALQDPLVISGWYAPKALAWEMAPGTLAFPAARRASGQRPDGFGGHVPSGGPGGGHGQGHGPGAGGTPDPADAASDDATVRHRFDDPEYWAERFDDPERNEWQKPQDLVDWLGLSRKDTVADIGAGTGYLNPYLSAAVGRKGKVLAIDVEKRMVAYMGLRALREQTYNVHPLLAEADDPKLGAGQANLVVVVDTYHHIDGRRAYFAALRDGMAAGGRLVVVDFKQGEIPVGPPEEHRIKPEQVTAELAEAGWKLQRQDLDLLPYQYVLEFVPAR